jgi:ATP-binding cassette subfamily C exporter for protease/lipase
MSAPAFFSRSALGRALWMFRRECLWVGVFSLFVNLLVLTPTLYMLQVYDRVMLSQSGFTLVALTLFATLLFGVMAFAEWLRSQLLVRAGVKFDQFLHAQVFDASFEANLNQSSHNPTQSFSDLTSVRQFLTGQGVFALFDLPWMPIYVAVLFLMHPLLGGLALVFAAVQGALAWWSHRRTAPAYEQQMQAQVAADTYLGGKLRHAETVHALGMLPQLRSRWLALHQAQMAAHHTAHDRAHQMQALTKLLQYSQQSLVLAAGALLVVRGELSMGAMVASNALTSNALRPISTLVGVWKQFIDARSAYTRLEQLLQAHPQRSADHAADTVRGQLTLRDLVATAPGRLTPILQGLNLEFRAGEVVAIVGPSGAGKSTLVRCLLGIWPQVQGQVLLDGQALDQWQRDQLGPHIGYLPQDVELFDGSLAENISRFGPLDPQQVIAAARSTGIHDMILRCPKGYDTPMGEAGNLFSGGQKQRIGLARALYGHPAIVALDEPNAHLDDAGLAALTRAIQGLRTQGKTVFMVVHQHSLLALADRVLVLQAGRVAQFGPQAPTRN